MGKITAMCKGCGQCYIEGQCPYCKSEDLKRRRVEIIKETVAIEEKGTLIWEFYKLYTRILFLVLFINLVPFFVGLVLWIENNHLGFWVVLLDFFCMAVSLILPGYIGTRYQKTISW